jgi:hypothetical protein
MIQIPSRITGGLRVISRLEGAAIAPGRSLTVPVAHVPRCG